MRGGRGAVTERRRHHGGAVDVTVTAHTGAADHLSMAAVTVLVDNDEGAAPVVPGNPSQAPDAR